ncbi:MAG: mobility-associated LCxxNW protein, partial [Lachnospiraceae bacterium]|nr:mobility-associated LCxxNW protein [Candidatus Merdinaster equi]
EIEEANSLCHGNWIEIQRKERYINLLQKLLADNRIDYPNEFDA